MSRAIACSTVSIPRALLNYLRKKEPSLFVHGNCWAVSAALCDRLKVKRLRTPREGKRAGGVNRRGRGKYQQVRNAPTSAGCE